MIQPLIILGSLGWLLVILFLIKLSRKHKKKTVYKVIHLSAILDGRVVGLFKSDILNGVPVVAQEDLELISSKRDDKKQSRVAKTALKVIDELSCKIEDGDSMSICKNLEAPLLVAGYEKSKVEIRGIECIDISSLDKLPQGRVYIGQKIKVKNVEYKYNKAQGYLDDGSIVEINGRLPEHENLILECRVSSIVEGKKPRKIYARCEND